MQGSCAWSFEPSTPGQDLGPLLRQVDGSGTSCFSDDDCPCGLVCGQVGVRVFNPTTKQYQPTEEIRMECGHQIGLWSAYQLCVWSGNTYVSPAPFEGWIDCPSHHSMFACAGHEPWITTCYSEGSHDDGCCGCANWAEILDHTRPESSWLQGHQYHLAAAAHFRIMRYSNAAVPRHTRNLAQLALPLLCLDMSLNPQSPKPTSLVCPAHAALSGPTVQIPNP